MILCSMPGKAGDILWALPTCRAISRFYGEPVDLVVGAPYQDVAEIARLQPYIRYAWADPEWQVRDTAPMTPRMPPDADPIVIHGVEERGEVRYDRVHHLGYREWPKEPLPFEISAQARDLYRLTFGPLDLEEPWITPPADVECWPGFEADITVGFTDEWIELKAGILFALADTANITILGREGGRWEEWSASIQACNDLEGLWKLDVSFLEAAACIAQGKVFLGCLSSKAVLARGMGKPTVLVEPNPQRHHPIFHEGIHKGLVLGNNGKPTFDARAVVTAVRKALGEAR